MDREEALKRFLEARDALQQQYDPTQGPGKAFVGTDAPTPRTVDLPDLSAPAQDLPGMALSVGAGYAGEKGGAKAFEMAADLVPEKYRPAAKLASKVLGAGGAAFLTDLGWQNLRRKLGTVDAPDNFEQTKAIATKTAIDQMAGGLWGEALARVGERTSLVNKMTDEKAQLMGTIQDALKRTYERIGGAPLVEDMRWRWNPMRILKPLETELNDSAVVQRLQDQGLDPKMARRVALQGGMTTADLLDSTPYIIMQSVAEGTASSHKYMQDYRGNRNRLYELMLEDLSNEFAAALPEEKMGEAVRAALNGNFNLPNALMTAGLQSVRSQINPKSTINVVGLRNYFKQQGLDANSPVAEMILSLPDNVSFDAIHRIRSNLSSLIHALDQDPRIVAEAKAVAKSLDKRMFKELPTGLDQHYLLSVQADDVLNEGQFKSKFVQNLLNNKQVDREFAKTLLRNSDVKSFRQMEAAAGRGAADNVRRALSESVIERGIEPDGSISPSGLHQALNEHGKYGRYFYGATLGPQWIHNVEMIRDTTDALLEIAKGRSLSDLGLGSLKYATVAPVIWDLYNKRIGWSTVAKFAAMTTVPKFLARIVTNPEATKTIVKATQMAKTGTNPRTFERLVARVAEAVGFTPEELAAAAQTPGVSRIERMRRDLGQGRFPSTGNMMVDTLVDPGQALGQFGSMQVPPQPPPPDQSTP